MASVKLDIQKGDLSELPLVVLLAEHYKKRSTGALVLQNGAFKKAIFLQKGLPVAIRTNIVGETLNKQLLRQGLLNEEQSEAVLQKIRSTDKTEAEIIREMSLLPDEQLQTLADKNFRDKLSSLFNWETGSFAYRDRMSAPAEAPPNGRPLSFYLYEGLQHGYPLDRLEEESGLEKNQYLAITAEAADAVSALPLDEEDKDLLGLLTGERKLEDLLTASEAIEVSAYRLLYLLKVLGMLNILGSAQINPKAQAAAARAQAEAGQTAPQAAGVPSGREATPRAPRPRSTPPPPPPAPPPPSEATAPSEPQPAKPAPEPPPKEGQVKINIPLNRESLQAELERIKQFNFYDLLGVSKEDEDRVIKRSYFRLAKFYHPDRFFNPPLDVMKDLAEEIFTYINKAYDTLTIPERRKDYDSYLATGRTKEEVSTEAQDMLQAEMQFGQGVGLLKKKDFAGAVEAFSWAIKLRPQEPDFHIELAQAKMQWGKKDQRKDLLKEAKMHLETALKIDSNNDKPYLVLGYLVKDDNPDEAQKYFAQAVKRNPDNIEAQREIRLFQKRKK